MPFFTMPVFTDTEIKHVLSQVDTIREALLGNCHTFADFPEGPVLKVGDGYPGIWLEHNQDNVFLADFAPEIAWRSQKMFMHFQLEDGLLPYMVAVKPLDKCIGYPDRKSVGYWHVQTVYPFARCALEIAKKTNRPREDYQQIYQAGSAYDAWFGKFRDTLKTGLVEMFCEYDTGHDKDPRVTDGGIPGTCPDLDARKMPDLPVLPIVSVDLSAALYGGRMALADIAEILGQAEEAAAWRKKAEKTRQTIKELLYDPEDDFYYDWNKQGFRKYRTEHITRLFLNRVLTQDEFDSIYERYFTIQGKGFCSPYPIPAVAIDDPHFDHTFPKNSWACNTQGLTTLRAILWMDHYGRSEDLTALLAHWLRAFLDHPETTYQQEIHPFTGAPIGKGVNYSPTLIIYLEAVKRLGWMG
ncbi:MAG: hypothetical protein GX927_10135 [Lentisphaerae bacterium]|nr:hypothetical protein [Lentisphaerota bacterium]